jgi:ribosome maturation factor RimP
VLDVEDPISGHYNLEVSSPGLDRPLFKLTHFERFVGQEIKLRAHSAVNGRRNFRGLLKAVVGDTIVMLADGQEFSISHSNVEKANLVPDFGDQ